MELPTTVLPVAGERSVLLLSPEPLRQQAHVRRIDHQGRLGPVHTVTGKQVVGAFDTAAHPLLLTSDGKRLCVERLDGATSTATCREARADLAVVLDDQLVLLERRPDDEPKDPAQGGKAKAGATGSKAAARPPRKGKPPARTGKAGAKKGKGRGKSRRSRRKKSSSPTPPKVVKPIEMRLWLHPVDPIQGVTMEAVDTGLTFKQPLPGMGLVDALGIGRRAQLLWYEHTKSRRDGRKRIPQARLRTAQLDHDGKLIRRSRALLFEGDRRYGYIDGHLQPRLFGRGGRAVFVGRFVDTKGTTVTRGWEAKVLSPWASITAGPPITGVDPARLAEPTALTRAETSAFDKIGYVDPRLVAGQPDNEAGRVAWVGDRGYGLVGGRLSLISRSSGEPKALAAPFVAQRSRLHWGVVTPSGTGLALTSDGLVELSPDGTVRRHNRTTDPGMNEPLGRPAQIGDSWWMMRAVAGAGAGGAVVRLLPDAKEAPALSQLAYRDSAQLVGGASHGLMVALRGDQLTVWRVDAAGAAQALGTYRSPIAGGFVAVRRSAGGALVAGSSRTVPARTLVLAIDDRGQLLPTHLSTIAVAVGGLQLVPLPGGGAWLTIHGGTRVAWLDDDGRELSTAGWPRQDSGAACLDGHPTRVQVPGPQPGTWLRLPAMAGRGSCTVSAPTWASDGSLRWFGTRVTGLDSLAELATVRPEASAPPAGAQPPVASPSSLPRPPRARAPAARPPCPPDMVYLPSHAGAQPGADLCVDRYESQLVDGATGVPLSPDYPTTPKLTGHVLSAWSAGHRRTGDLHARAMPLPPLLRAATAAPKVVARSRVRVVPSGYLTSFVAAKACQAAGKRMCTLDEWKRACRGEQNRDFPYGDDYAHGVCNVYRYAHPAATLHGSAAVGHLDPRLNRVTEAGAPLLRTTGATTRCASRWGDDAIYDMVGNLDEWVDKKGGAFAGGFYSRSTRSGCSAAISVHPRRYLDYSLGTRCCLSPRR
ncbi:MAG: SUMF1/EgtB/PvdO family nonheme iron enzyme [Deltaproteobacteria bacterium]|nr:SUMF1/EgtB/PvdO family nonheme iron enzyme [Deltaproteobacteria bacterium]